MSTIDPAKLKVVELRAELSTRGLDAKGNKPVLVKRLKEALEKELEQEIPDTSIVDTSTEDVNTSQESAGDDGVSVPPDKKAESPVPVDNEPTEEPAPAKVEVEKPKQQQPPPAEVQEEEEAVAECVVKEAVVKVVEKEKEDKEEKEIEKSKDEALDEPMAAVEENGENVDHEMQEDVKPEEVGAAVVDAEEVEVKAAESEQPKGEKRRRSSPSPERVQRRRSKTPIKEDEPVLDNNKVQLSWYDSDLHLEVDKKTFLSGRPYHEGAFGYAWAGVRATHGAKSGKVCFEVKITEELKWEELANKQPEKKRESHRSEGSRRERQRSEKDGSRDKGDRDSPHRTDDDAKPDSEKDKSDNYNEDSPDQSEKSEEKPEGRLEEADVKMNEEADTKPAEDESMAAKVEKLETEEPSGEGDAKDDEKEELAKSEAMEVDEPETPGEPFAKHLFRVGWSAVDSGLQLGEAKYSYGFESSGKFVTDKEFVDYGVKFGVGDVIGAYLNIGEESVGLTYTVNGEEQPEASSIPRSDISEENFALFPHILSRNYVFEMNLGAREEPWFPHPADLADYCYLDSIEDKIQGPCRPEARGECEVIMMCGLPASGKTHWVREMVKENPDKRYTIIGNNHLFEKMTVNGNPLKSNYKGRWNVVLDKLMKCVNVLVETAALRRRNYVIDQTNVFPSAQRRKMRLFEGFKRRAVVVVVADEEQAKRRAQQEAQDGKDVPDSAILEMKANMSLPRRGEWLEEVSYVELAEEEAKALVQKYNQQGRDAGFGPIQRGGYRDARGHPYRWDHSTSRRDYRGGYRDNRSYQNNRYDRSRQQAGWQNRRPPPGSWNRDIRRDSRGPPGGGSRDFRNNNRSSTGSGGRPERSGSRDNRNRNQSVSNYNRSQRPQSSRNQPASWQGGGGGGSGGSWQNQNWGGGGGGGQGMWNQGSWGQGSWGGQAQQWKGSYSQSGYGQSGYGQGYANWNYYGQYAQQQQQQQQQNWNSQGQPQTTTAGGGTSASDSAAYGQYSQQAAWAHYAQQYAQQGQASTATQQPSVTQK